MLHSFFGAGALKSLIANPRGKTAYVNVGRDGRVALTEGDAGLLVALSLVAQSVEIDGHDWHVTSFGKSQLDHQIVVVTPTIPDRDEVDDANEWELPIEAVRICVKSTRHNDGFTVTASTY